ncbi:LOW QUALITY PROTEIN: D-xylose-proton symporter-like 2 [Carica papaya]|uniref:LOW QUALITY PROTEIN: D-xylose-proton symporter-like 2 n=1 Tax=Carica papaya TaxID=3649 RepID=UPI000B8CA37D|nr:LOW QUALITY PROTEIN: D-xylose-proton symporter-like 2 [Carica papaya]
MALMGGFARIGNNEITILVNDAEKSSDIDPQETQQTLEIAEANLRKAEGKRQTTEANLALRRAHYMTIYFNMLRALYHFWVENEKDYTVIKKWMYYQNNLNQQRWENLHYLDVLEIVAQCCNIRRELILAAFLYLAGALVTSVARDFIILVTGRFVYGIGIGLAMHAAPVYIAETAPSQIRGQLISLKEFFIVLGMVGGYGIGSLLIDVVAGWRYMYGASTPLAVIMVIGMWCLPPSPRWLLLCAVQGKGDIQALREAAICCLCQLRGQAIGDSALQQVDGILAELSLVGEEKEVTLAEIFRGKCLKALVIGVGILVFQQITGQPSVLYYAASILQSAGFSAASDATRVSLLLGFLKLMMSSYNLYILFGCQVISLFLLGSYYIFLDTPFIAVLALLLYVGCYQLSFGPIGWLMISEIFPLRLRGRGLGIAVLVNFGANALVTFAFSPLKELIGAGLLFYMFGGIAVLSLFFIFFIVPETKGLTLEEIEAKCL